MNDQQAVIEGILFVVGDEGITLSQLSGALEIGEAEAQKQLDEMTAAYAADERRGIEIVCYGGRYKFVSKAFVDPYCQKVYALDTTRAFSQAALETLAIIAYKQPVTRAEIEEIRGVGCDMMIRKLLARGLIREAGRLDAAGKPYTYEVTEQFMDTFKLKSLDELPELPDYGQPEEDKGLYD
jgi:segregation and condensation protein B